MTDKNERIQILEMIESGVITAAEGARLLQALDADDRLEESLEGEFQAEESGGMPGRPGASPIFISAAPPPGRGTSTGELATRLPRRRVRTPGGGGGGPFARVS